MLGTLQGSIVNTAVQVIINRKKDIHSQASESIDFTYLLKR